VLVSYEVRASSRLWCVGYLGVMERSAARGRICTYVDLSVYTADQVDASFKREDQVVAGSWQNILDKIFAHPRRDYQL